MVFHQIIIDTNESFLDAGLGILLVSAGMLVCWYAAAEPRVLMQQGFDRSKSPGFY
jgi:hypothetical protein